MSGQTVVTTYEIKGKNVGTYTGTFGNEFKIMADEKDVTENYNTPTRNPGKLVISKAEITKYVTLNPTDVEETYDGTAKAAGKATASDSNNNDLKIEYQKADGSWTENPAEITATDVADSKQVEVRVSSEGNYEGYAYCTEKLTIKKRDITLTGSGWESTQPYTGQEYSKTDYTSEEANTANTRGLVSGQIVEATYELKGINVGEYTGEFKNITIKSVKGLFGLNVENTTSNYSISTEVGELQISRRNVTLTSDSSKKPYDGTALTNKNVIVSGDGFAEGEGAKFAVTGTITNVGTKVNTFGYTLNDNTLASNYNISTELGTLTITPKSIIPDGPVTPEEEKTGITVENPGDVKYDGKDYAEKPVIKDEKTGVTLEEGKDYEIVYPEDIKNAGEITATVVGKGDYEGSFEIKYNITKRDVTFTSATDSKQYDGNALTNGNVEITGDGFIEGEGATFNVTGSITDVGSTNNTFTYAMNEGTNVDNYNVTVVEGTLTVSEQPVVPTPVTPTTPSNNTPARTNNVPARAVTQPTTTTPAPEATVEPEKAETTPAPTAKPEKIKEEATPQAAPKGHWALINLIAAMLSVVLAVVALLAKHAKDEDEDDEDKDDQVVANENEDDDENESTRHRRWKVIATIDAILAVVVFILTENISLPMVLVDKWTLLMVLFGLISIVSTYFARKWHEEDEDEDEESSQNA